MKIGVTGITGFVGGHVASAARQRGWDVVGYSRGSGHERRFSVDAPVDCGGLDAVVHLAGESILGLWTRSKREGIRRSRVEGTRRVVEGIREAGPHPQVLVCASAVGIYGDTGEEAAVEQTAEGTGFLADVVREWEAEAVRAEEFGVRVVRLRIGFVLGKGGAMGLIAPIFRLGLGGNLGSGRQWMSGIHVEDVAGMAVWAVEQSEVEGAVNVVMPCPFRNSEFTAAVASALRRPAFLPAPAFALRLALGELSGVMLNNCRVLPEKALAAAYRFRYPGLAQAIEASLT